LKKKTEKSVIQSVIGYTLTVQSVMQTM